MITLERKREIARNWKRRNLIKVKDPERYAAYVASRNAHLVRVGVVNSANKRRKYTPETKRIREIIRKSLSNAIYRYDARKLAKTLDLIDMNIVEFKEYIATKFQDGMSWENYGQWELDHIRPVSSFDLTQEDQQRSCFNYTNYQPLWMTDNRRKAARV